MLTITCDEAPLLRSLMAELGISKEQEVADIAIDVFSHCLTKIVASGEPYRMNLDQIHRISPAAITLLRLTGPSWTFKMSTVSAAEFPIRGHGPLTLTFNGNRFAAMQKWMRHLGLDAEHRVLKNAVTLLRSAVTANRNGDSITVYKKYSVLRARTSHDSNIKHSSPPPLRETSLLN